MVQLVHGCWLFPGQVGREGSYAEALNGCLNGELLRHTGRPRLGLHESLEVIPQSFPLTLPTVE